MIYAVLTKIKLKIIPCNFRSSGVKNDSTKSFLEEFGMNKNDAWTFFENTGNLDAYLIYKHLENDKSPFEAKRDKELFLQGSGR